MNFFIMVYEREPEKSYALFHKDFVAHKQIYRWWHFLKTAYLVVTDLEAKDLSEHLKSMFEKYDLGKTHVILEANFGHRAGWLPKRAWEWLDREAQKQWKELDPDED
jgi:hypothetical protein